MITVQLKTRPKDWKRLFTKETVGGAKKHVQRGPTSLSSGTGQLNTATSYNYTAARAVSIKNLKLLGIGRTWRWGIAGLLENGITSPEGWGSFYEVKHAFSIRSRNPTSAHFPRGMKTWVHERLMHKCLLAAEEKSLTKNNQNVHKLVSGWINWGPCLWWTIRSAVKRNDYWYVQPRGWISK